MDRAMEKVTSTVTRIDSNGILYASSVMIQTNTS